MTSCIFTGSAEAEVGGTVANNLEEGQQSRVFFQCPEEGLTVRVCAPRGRIQAYGSHCTSSPSEAFHDFMFVIEEGNCDDI